MAQRDINSTLLENVWLRPPMQIANTPDSTQNNDHTHYMNALTHNGSHHLSDLP